MVIPTCGHRNTSFGFGQIPLELKIRDYVPNPLRSHKIVNVYPNHPGTMKCFENERKNIPKIFFP